VEAISSRAGASAGSWARQFLLEMIHESYRATMSACDRMTDSCKELRHTYPLHVVTDCNSLHETVTKDSLPEDKRAAIEILAIKEIVSEEFFDDSSDEDLTEADRRLCDFDLSTHYHWTEAACMKADILTKVHPATARRAWMETIGFVRRTSMKKSLPAGPSRMRTPIPRRYFEQFYSNDVDGSS
jgi:hypothetical protein